MVTEAQLNSLLAYVPHFHLSIIGPWAISPHPMSVRVSLDADYIVASSLEQAVDDVIEAHIKPFCAERDYAFNAAEWAVLTVRRCNFN